MRKRARVAGLIGGLALALVGSLSGCITVHGETAIVPAATKGEAQQALDRFVKLSNEANSTYDPKVNERIERGPMGAIDHAALRANREVNGGSNPDFQPMELSDTAFHIPQQSGWPKYFLADTAINWDDDRWLLVFTRNSIDEEWFASYRAVLPADEVPEFATDADGHLEDMPVGRAYPRLALSPRDLSAEYTAYLQDAQGPFLDGDYTTGLLALRDEENSSPEFAMDYQDEPVDPAAEPQFAPVAVRLADGGALVLFTTHHFDRQSVAAGYTPSVHPLVAALMEGEAVTEVTREWVGMQTALVPEGEGAIEIVDRTSGVIAAQGK